ncbi:MAG: DUF58 domain-containing protein, partial [Polyangiaceae bacterium]|nr:DUF58 domain-containing protein [Polyangiaceae bacterium]
MKRHEPLDPDLVARIAQLSVRAKVAADGALTGLHRSPHRGASVVFVEHREYRPGDDPRLLDWRAYARTDRPTLKRFEQETQLSATLLLDRSSSMAFTGAPDRPTKSDHASTLLGALALLLLRQGDRVGALTFADRVRELVPHASGTGHLEPLLRGLLDGEGAPATDLIAALGEALPRAGRRGFVAIASDLLEADSADASIPGGLAALRSFAAKGHEVWVLHVLDPAEIELDLPNACRVHGLEGEPSVEVPGANVREAYARAIGEFLECSESTCRAMGVHYVLARTDEDPALTLGRMLGREMGAPATARPSRGRPRGL